RLARRVAPDRANVYPLVEPGQDDAAGSALLIAGEPIRSHAPGLRQHSLEVPIRVHVELRGIIGEYRVILRRKNETERSGLNQRGRQEKKCDLAEKGHAHIGEESSCLTNSKHNLTIFPVHLCEERNLGGAAFGVKSSTCGNFF